MSTSTTPTPPTSPAPPTSARTRRLKGKLKDAALGYAFLLPSLIVFAVFAYYPLYRLVYYATHRQSRFRNKPATWVGTEQLTATLSSQDFIDGLVHSGLYMLYTVPLGLFLGVVLATSTHRRLKGIKVFQTVFSSTVATSVAVSNARISTPVTMSSSIKLSFAVAIDSRIRSLRS